MPFSDFTRRKENFHFGQAFLFSYDPTLSRFVSFGYTQDSSVECAWEVAQLMTGTPAAMADEEITQASVTLSCQLLEVSAANLVKLLPSTLVRTVTGATLESFDEVATLVGTTGTLMRFKPVLNVPDAPLVKNITGTVTYTLDTGTFSVPAGDGDYIIDLTNGIIKRAHALSMIPDGGQVKLQYHYNDTAATVVHVGGRQCSSKIEATLRLRLLSRTKTCAYRGVEIHKAVPQSPLTIPFANTHTVLEARFSGQDDETQPLGYNLWNFVLGSAAQI